MNEWIICWLCWEPLTFNDLHLNQRKYHHMSISNVIELEFLFKNLCQGPPSKNKKKRQNYANQFFLKKKSLTRESFGSLSLRSLCDLAIGTLNVKKNSNFSTSNSVMQLEPKWNRCFIFICKIHHEKNILQNQQNQSLHKFAYLCRQNTTQQNHKCNCIV